LAHLFVKRRHTWRFWKTVRIIYPKYEKGRKRTVEIRSEIRRKS
jgi:predicted metal-dependent hydrolase